MPVPRGAIRNRQYGTQVKDYSRLCYGNITPTDLDGLIEYKNLGYVLIETKHGEAEMAYGQKLALERLTDDLGSVKPVLTMVTRHECVGDIDMAETQVVEFRFRDVWHRPDDVTTAKQLVDRFINWLEFPSKVQKH